MLSVHTAGQATSCADASAWFAQLASSHRRYMYVADLVSMPSERGKGYGKVLFAWLESTAKNAGATRCAQHAFLVMPAPAPVSNPAGAPLETLIVPKNNY